MVVSLYHHRSRKAFERWLNKQGIGFKFDGYGCGYHDPYYILETDSVDWSSCPVEVWDDDSKKLTRK